MLYFAVKNISSSDEESLKQQIAQLKHHFTEKINVKRKESAFSKILLNDILTKYYKLDYYLIDADSSGKPYIVDSDIHFNISHSGDYVMCCCSKAPVGCDIQQIKALNIKVARRFFTENEYNLLLNDENRDVTFENKINVIEGENESGKSTILKFILNSFL